MRSASKAVTPREGLPLQGIGDSRKGAVYPCLLDGGSAPKACGLPPGYLGPNEVQKKRCEAAKETGSVKGARLVWRAMSLCGACFTVLRLITLFLPTVIPSWRFFKTVAPSPRIEYRLIEEGGSGGRQVGDWQEDRPRPVHLGLGQMLRRMFWNPDWNEQLYLVSCSERLIEAPSQHSIDEINLRVARLLPLGGQKLQFRLVFLSREGDQLVKLVDYESTPVSLAGLQAAWV